MNTASTPAVPAETTGQFGYVGFFNQKRIEFYADSLYAAKQEAIRQFKPKKREEHMVSVMLAEKDGKPVEHVADF